MKIVHMEASNVMLSLMTSQSSENAPKRVVGKTPKSDLVKNLPKGNGSRLEKCVESLNLKGIESWNEQQQQSARNLIIEYQHLFAMNLSELGKTSLVQHDIKLDDMMPFKEQYQGIPPHQYEEVKKHLQEMLEIGAIFRSTSQWARRMVA